MKQKLVRLGSATETFKLTMIGSLSQSSLLFQGVDLIFDFKIIQHVSSLLILKFKYLCINALSGHGSVVHCCVFLRITKLLKEVKFSTSVETMLIKNTKVFLTKWFAGHFAHFPQGTSLQNWTERESLGHHKRTAANEHFRFSFFSLNQGRLVRLHYGIERLYCSVCQAKGFG